MTKKLFAIFALSVAFLFAAANAADDLRAGVDYISIDPPLPERVDAGKIEVVEFFNFSCPHCFRLQKPFSSWKKEFKQDDVAIVHQPLVFSRHRGHYARVYYTLEAFGLVEEFAPQVYRAIHSEKILINGKSRFLDWLEEKAGVNPEEAEAVYDSFSVSNSANSSLARAIEYGIDSTPQLAIAGKYVINASLSGSYERMLETLTVLVERERKLRAKI